MYTYKAKIIKIVDGDTLDAEVDMGFNMFAHIRFRIRGVDTPEIFSPKSKEEYNKGILAKIFVEQKIPVGSFVTIRSYKEAAYNRWEADVLTTTNESIADLLIKEGLIK